MNKSFPTVLPRSLAALSAAGTMLLTGCVGYYPDPYPAPAPQPYYYGGGGGYYDPYYADSYYYGPTYGPNTVYIQTYTPGYYYRPGYGYYAPPPRGRPPSKGHDDDHRGGWGDKAREVTGDNPSRYPHGQRPDNRGNDGRGWQPPRTGESGPGNGSGYNPGNPPRNSPSNGGGWASRIPQSGDNGGGQRFPAPQQQAPRPSPPPQQDSSQDRGGKRGGWGERARERTQ
jgi:hypothetical protein